MKDQVEAMRCMELNELRLWEKLVAECWPEFGLRCKTTRRGVTVLGWSIAGDCATQQKVGESRRRLADS